jgi:membrane protein implicated in regulation of membrane protease activity
MTWADFYLVCFVVGIAFSLLSIFGGGSRLHLHLPHFAHGHAIGPIMHGGHAAGHAAGGRSGDGSHAGHVSVFNFVTLTAFLAWFGGTGYLLTTYSSLWFLAGLGISILAGLVGAAIIFQFFIRVLTSDDENLDPADFEMCGVLGRTSVSIRAGGTGEIIYSQEGTRRTCGARSEDGNGIAKGTEVVVTRYEKGIAYVKLWSELSGEELSAVESEKAGVQTEKEL